MPEEVLTVISMIGTLLLMLAVFVGAYYVSKLVARHYQPKCNAPNSIEILDKAMLGKEQALVIAKVAGKVFLIGSTPQNITRIAELDAEMFPEKLEQPPIKPDFLSIMKDAIKNRNSNKEVSRK